MMTTRAIGRVRRANTRRLLLTLLSAIGLSVAVSGVAWAFWATTGSGSASAATGTLKPPTGVTVPSTSAGTLAVTWTAPSGTPAATGYNVKRTSTGTLVTADVCGTPATPVTPTSCNDSSVASGTYTYTVTAIYRSWTAVSAASNAVTVATASQLAFTGQPSATAIAGSAFAAQPVVKVLDAAGNPVASDTSPVTLALTTPAGATLACTGGNSVAAVAGIVTFAGCNIDKAGTYTLTATDGFLSSSVSSTITISAGTAAQLAFAQQPSTTTAGSAITPAVTVRILDQFGNLTTSTASVDVAIGTNPAGGALSGTHPKAAVAGVATFSNLSINKAGVGYTLTATSAGLSGAVSSTFDVTAAAATKLVFTQQPAGGTGGTSFTTQPKIAVQDAGGNVVTTDTSAVTLAITSSTGTAGAALTCTANPNNATSGVATFAGCNIDKTGTAYTLTATDGSLTSAVSATLNVTLGGASKLGFTTSPTDSAAANGFLTQPVVTVQDAGGNTVSATTSITLTITSGTGTTGAVLGCTTNPKSATAGIATFAGCTIDKAGNGYTLHAAGGALAAATSAVFNLFGPTALTITNGTGTAGKAEAGDVITTTWSQAIQLSSVCSTWTSAAQTVTGVTVTMSRGNGGNHNDLSLSLGTVGTSPCAGGIGIGTFTTSSSNYESGSTTHTFTNSTVTWNAAQSQLIITLGTGVAAPNTVTNSTYVYNPAAAIARSGLAGVTAGGTASTGNVKNF